ncbi:MAG: mRNA-degrading endonuclease RelE of RelBE toxin-antitoxin system [Polaribacter sp.]|jgi:mRNA-degrading endonuclease RelE of RelBE toxin-antitoxin system
MLNYRLSKQALKSLSKIEKSDKNLARRIDQKIVQLREQEITGEALQGASDYSKVRVGKYRIISTVRDNMLWVYIIEKRESVYQTFQHFLRNV